LFSPTAQASLAEYAQTPQSHSLEAELTIDQALPFQCTIVPVFPTAQTSLVAVPLTARS